VQPWVGPLTWDFNWEFGKWKNIAGGISEKFALPAIKKKDK
jgi:signal peptidase complex subunit 3